MQCIFLQTGMGLVGTILPIHRPMKSVYTCSWYLEERIPLQGFIELTLKSFAYPVEHVSLHWEAQLGSLETTAVCVLCWGMMWCEWGCCLSCHRPDITAKLCRSDLHICRKPFEEIKFKFHENPSFGTTKRDLRQTVDLCGVEPKFNLETWLILLVVRNWCTVFRRQKKILGWHKSRS